MPRLNHRLPPYSSAAIFVCHRIRLPSLGDPPTAAAMPFTSDFALPAGARGLSLPDGPAAKLFLVFTTSDDPATGASWCPDVRAARTCRRSLCCALWPRWNWDWTRPVC